MIFTYLGHFLDFGKNPKPLPSQKEKKGGKMPPW
jgi:hypothetical protein